LTWLVPL